MATQTGGDLVVDALRLINALAAGELPAGYEAQDGQMRLNDLLGNWDTLQLQIYFIENLTFVMSSSTSVVTAGVGGNITTRPVKIESANSIRGGLTNDITLVDSRRWAQLKDKAATAKIPELLYNDNAFPLANLNIWPQTSDNLTTLDLWIWGPFTSFTTTLYTDLVIDGSNANKVTSAANPFTSGDVNNYLNVPQGVTGFTPGRYQITAVVGSTATLSANIGTLAQTGGIASYDQALALPPGYWKALRFNLALDLLPEYGRVDAGTANLIAQNAMKSLAELRGINQANQSATEAPPVPEAPAPQNPGPSA